MSIERMSMKKELLKYISVFFITLAVLFVFRVASEFIDKGRFLHINFFLQIWQKRGKIRFDACEEETASLIRVYII